MERCLNDRSVQRLRQHPGEDNLQPEHIHAHIYIYSTRSNQRVDRMLAGCSRMYSPGYSVRSAISHGLGFHDIFVCTRLSVHVCQNNKPCGPDMI